MRGRLTSCVTPPLLHSTVSLAHPGTRLHFGHRRPAYARGLDVDNLGRGRDHVRHPRHSCLEVLRVDVHLASGAIPEGFEQDKLMGRVNAARPLKEDVARLGAGGGREGGNTREPLVRDLGTDGKFDGDKDHHSSLSRKRCCIGALLPTASRAGKTPSRPSLWTAHLKAGEPGV